MAAYLLGAEAVKSSEACASRSNKVRRTRVITVLTGAYCDASTCQLRFTTAKLIGDFDVEEA